jgi:hypothetical protein
LYPAGPKTVFHHFLNGFDMTFTFQRNLWGQVTGAQGTFNFDPYNISLPYNLTRPGVASYNTSLWITIVVFGILLVVPGSILGWRRRRKGTGEVH